MMRWMALGALVCTALVGCSSSSTSTTTEPNSTEPKQAVELERLVFSFQRQKDPATLKEDASKLGQQLSAEIGIPVDVVVPTSYGVTAQALISNRAHVAYMSSLPYLLASREAKVEVLLVEERKNATKYDSVLVVRADSPIQTLDQLKGTKIAFTSPTSASGYVFPYAHFVQKGMIVKGAKPESWFSQAIFAGGYDKALNAVLRGQADVAAVSDYTMEGDTADKYLPAEDRAKLRILARIPNVPTHLIAIRADLPEPTKQRIRETLLKLGESQPELLADVYGAAKFVQPTADHVAATQAALEATGLDVNAVVEK